MASINRTAPTSRQAIRGPTNLPWQPVLQRELRQRAWKRIDEIEVGLRTFCDRLQQDDLWQVRFPTYQYTLSGGEAGLSLFYAYLDGATGRAANNSNAVENFLNQSIEGIGTKTDSLGLYSGFVGVAWALEHLRDYLELSADEDPLLEIDSVLATHLKQSPWIRDYDLVKGLVGHGVYALDRLPRPLAANCLKSIVQRFSELAEHGPGGTVRWHTDAKFDLDITQRFYPDGCYNLGVAHGIPGVIALLAKIARNGIDEATARELATGAVDWLLRQKFEVLGLDVDLKAIFPRKVAPGVDPLVGGPTGLAWCYGDLGIACSLLVAARSLDEESWEEEAISIGLNTAERDDDSLVEPGLCHGAAGVGHLFNRLFQATGRKEFRDAAVRWYGEALDMRQEGETIAGFGALGEDEQGQLAWRPYPGVITGAAGVGLALLAAVSENEPEWDRFMLLS